MKPIPHCLVKHSIRQLDLRYRGTVKPATLPSLHCLEKENSNDGKPGTQGARQCEAHANPAASTRGGELVLVDLCFNPRHRALVVTRGKN